MSGVDDECGAEFTPLVELAEAFTELVELFTERQSVSLTPDGLVRLAARCVPRAQFCDLTVLEDGRPRSVAASGTVVNRLEEIRMLTGQGPALDVLEVNDLVYSGDLLDDPRWPEFGPRATAELGVRSVASYRLYLGPRHRAALTVSSEWPYAFDEVALAIGAIFAAYCSLVLFTDLVLRDQLSPRRAVEVHREIGVAIGILMAADAASGSGPGGCMHAYRRLREASRAARESLEAVAQHVISHHRLPDASARPEAQPEW